MLRHAIVVAAVLCIQEQTEEASIEEELARLIEQTNALETFHLVYELESTDEEVPSKATFDLIYQAPDFARLRMTSTEGDADNWLTEGQMFFRSDLGGDGGWSRVVVPEPLQASLLLEEMFPGPELPLGPGVQLDMELSGDASTGKARFGMRFRIKHFARGSLLGWLTDIQRRSSEVEVDGEWFVLRGKDHRLRFARKNGFLDRVEAYSDEGHTSFQLVECHLDEPLDRELLELPAEAKAAQIDAEIARALQENPDNLRRKAFLRVEELLATEKRPWNERTRADWRTFLAELHRERIPQCYAKWLEDLQGHLDGLVNWVMDRRKQDDTEEGLARIKEQIATSRADLEDTLEATRTKYGDALRPIESTHRDPRDELYELEAEVIGEVWDEVMTIPVLEAFDEETAAVMER